MTGVGEVRAAYAVAFAEVDPRPSRFADEGATYRAWAERANAWAADEAGGIARAFPGRNRRGYVIGYYVYRRGVSSEQVAGPFATVVEAEAARDGVTSMDRLDVIAGLVFTSRGTIVRHLDVEANGAGPVSVGRAADLAHT
ncbi:hypothetical protein QE418_003396 [Microbacterium testaceum]|uniref:hypothetical protein n=1 Tax=Microbacterium TaxID=33882 RepID=UPI00278923D2|nr:MULTISPECIES: hypothetical protein [Microbacterium]MDQ1113948.1 hypothetical protein [Microbacterium testaceum]MDR6098945.1 hypothetical protein [Microbacterium sp. SORGH_AS_0454]